MTPGRTIGIADFGESRHGKTGLHPLQASLCVAVKPRGIDSFVGRQIRCEFLETFAELPLRAPRVFFLTVIEGDCNVDDLLEEEPPRSLTRTPDFLEHFMADEKVAPV